MRNRSQQSGAQAIRFGGSLCPIEVLDQAHPFDRDRALVHQCIQQAALIRSQQRSGLVTIDADDTNRPTTGLDGQKETLGSRQGVRAAAELAGAAPIIEALPKGYQSLLGHWFAKGNELSTGEWQRIALASASFRNAPVLILDEPTSAMDPWAEADWLQRFREMATGRTAMVSRTGSPRR